MNSFYKTSETLRKGAKTLPQKYYVDNTIFKKEISNFFHNGWICCGRSQELQKPGEYKLVEIENESIIILKNEKNKINAFYNICRHRGTKICIKDQGCFSRSIQCPYHGWTYDLNGTLYATPNMDTVKNFIKDAYSLHKIKLTKFQKEFEKIVS